MKKILSAVLLFSAISANAQVTSHSHSHTGYFDNTLDVNPTEVQLKIGPGFNTVTNGDQISSTAGSRTGLALAADINLPVRAVSRNFSILTGVEYLQKGISGGNNDQNSFSFAMNYFEIPVLAQYNLSIARTSKLTFGFGPYFAFAASRSLDTNDQSFDASNQTNVFDFGVRAAVGFETAFTREFSFVGDLNYDFGFLNAASTGDQTFANRSFILDLGVAMKI